MAGVGISGRLVAQPTNTSITAMEKMPFIRVEVDIYKCLFREVAAFENLASMETDHAVMTVRDLVEFFEMRRPEIKKGG